MTKTDTLTAFRTLTKPAVADTDTFTAIRVGDSAHRIGKDSRGNPALLIQTGSLLTTAPAPIALQHLTVEHRVRCRISESSEARNEEVSLVRCISDERSLRECFIRIAELTVADLGEQPSIVDVNRAIRKLIDLFRALEQPAGRTVQGLWAELAVITFAGSPDRLIDGWHVDPHEAFDFAAGPCRLEVKSFAGQGRTHHFSLAQARPGPGISAVIASLRAERSSGGASIANLIERLAATGVHSRQLERVELVVARSLGDSAGTGLAMGFDLERARASLRFFDTTAVPFVEPPFPTGVVDVRVQSALDESAALTTEQLECRNSFFRDLVPTGAAELAAR